MSRFSVFGAVVAALLMLCACGEDRTWQYEEKTQHNQWMLGVMKDQYLWADALAGYEPDWKNFFAKPAAFMKTLAGMSGHSDSWSYLETDTLTEDRHERGYFNHYDSYGMDYALMTDPTRQTTRQMLRVLTVYPNSPASWAGLKRGDFICAYDGNKITNANAAKLSSGIARTLEVRHVAVNEEESTFYWSDTATVTLEASRYVEDVAFPVCNTRDCDGTRVGYLLCSRLVSYAVEQGEGASAGNAYRDQLDRAMAGLLAAGIDEMLLDLRLCNYGTIDMAQRLASYVVAPQALGQTMLTTFRNSAHASANRTVPYDTSLGNLGLSRIYIIVGSYTQGAAEWLIHALQCSMGTENVIIVGLATKGQNVMTELVAHDYHQRLYPVVAYVGDANGDYGYSSLTPTKEVNEQDYVVMGNYGEPDDILYYTAVANILGLDQETEESESSDGSDNSADESDNSSGSGSVE